MKHVRGAAFLLAVMLFAALPSALAEEACTGHRWKLTTTVEAATCQQTGVGEYTCNLCGATMQDAIAKKSHNYGEWTVLLEPTCVSTGERTRTCGWCEKPQTEITKDGPHEWGDWAKSADGTCVAEGEEQRVCALCGGAETRTTGLGDHVWTEWTVTVPETDHSAGRRERMCTACEEQVVEDYDPEGTLRRENKSNDKEEVKALQQALNDLGFNCGTADGIFGKKTAAAISAFQESAGLEADGIAWPQTRAALADALAQPATE